MQLDNALCLGAVGRIIHTQVFRLLKEFRGRLPNILREAETGGCTCRADLPCGCGAVRLVKRVRCTETPTSEELLRNPRARSARLRVVEKLAPAGVN